MRAVLLLLILLLSAGAGIAQEGATGSVEGRVMDPDGEPLAGLRVNVAWGFDVVETTTGADGSYRVDAFPVGPVSAIAFPDRLDPATRVAAAYTCQLEADCPRVVEGETTTLNVRLPWAAFLRGVVRDEAGEPVEGATLIPMFWNLLEEQVIAKTGADGAYRVALIAGHYGLDVFADATRYLGVNDTECLFDHHTCLSLWERETTWHNVTLPATGKIAGILRDETGGPVAGGFVELHDDRAPRGESRMSVNTTDHEGRFLLWSPHEGPHRLEASGLWVMTGLCDDEPSPCVDVSKGVTREQDAHLRRSYNATFETIGFPAPFKDEHYSDQLPASLWLVHEDIEFRTNSWNALDLRVTGPAGAYDLHIVLRNESGSLYEGPVSCPRSPCLELPLEDDSPLRLVRTSEGVMLEDRRDTASPVNASPEDETFLPLVDAPSETTPEPVSPTGTPTAPTPLPAAVGLLALVGAATVLRRK